MNKFEFNKINKKGMLSVLILVSFIGIVTFILYAKRPESIAQKNLMNVTKAVLIFPDAGVVQLIAETENTSVDTTADNKDQKIGERLHQNIVPYMTDSGADALVKDWYDFGFFCAGTEWTSKAGDIRIKVEDSTQRSLLFQVKLICENKQTQKKTLQLEGKAQYTPSGQLNYWALSGDSIQAMRRLNEEFLK